MTYPAWMTRNRVKTIVPGKFDLVTLTLVDGRRANIRPITEYDAAVAAARVMLETHQCDIMVLPLSASAIGGMLSLGPPQAGEPGDAAERQETINLLINILVESGDSDARRDAYRQLDRIEVIKA